MPSTFDRFKYAPTVSQYVPLPTQELAGLGAALDTKYMQNKAAYSALEDAFLKVPALQKDEPLRNQLLQGYRDQFDKALKSSDGGYERLTATIDQLARDFKKDYTTGTLGAINTNYNLYQDHLKNIQDRFDKGEITKTQYDKALTKSLGEYSGVQPTLQQGERFNRYSGHMPAQYQDLTKQAFEMVKGWEADGTVGPVKQSEDGRLLVQYKGEWVAYDEVYNAAMKALMGNDKNAQYVQDNIALNSYGADFSKLDPKAIDSEKEKLMNSATFKRVMDMDDDEIKALDARGLHNAVSMFREFHNAVAPAAEKAAFRKTDMKWNTNPFELELFKQKIDPENFTLENESVLVPGKEFDYNKSVELINNVTNQITDINKRIAGIKDGSNTTDDLYQLEAQRNELTMQQKIAQNTHNNITNSFKNSTEGKNYLNNQISEVKSLIKGYIDGASDPKSKEDLRKAYSVFSSDKVIEDFITGNTDLAGLGISQGTSSPILRIRKQTIDKLTDHAQNKPISYSANVLTGGKKSFITSVNTALTDRVNDNRTNYWVEGGLGLDEYINSLGEEMKINVAAMDNDINGNFAHYMTVTDKDGKTISQVPIYPKKGGAEEQDMIGRKLMEENAKQNDSNAKRMYNKGLQMRANSAFPTLNSSDVENMFKTEEFNKLGESDTGPIDVVGPDGNNYKFSITKERKDGNTVYSLYDAVTGKQLIKDKKSIAEIKVSLFQDAD